MNPLRPKKQEDLTYCDCSECGKTILGDRWRPWYLSLPPADQSAYQGAVAGRINGRPVCGRCLNQSRRPPGRPAPREDAPPSWDDAVRALEEDR